MEKEKEKGEAARPVAQPPTTPKPTKDQAHPRPFPSWPGQEVSTPSPAPSDAFLKSGGRQRSTPHRAHALPPAPSPPPSQRLPIHLLSSFLPTTAALLCSLPDPISTSLKFSAFSETEKSCTVAVSLPPWRGHRGRPHASFSAGTETGGGARCAPASLAGPGSRQGHRAVGVLPPCRASSTVSIERSEERRVGKEC